MRKDELAAPSRLAPDLDALTPSDPAVPDAAAIPIPVICDICRAQGTARDVRFAAVPDILTFKPVKRRLHVNNWTEGHQRAFIAALAITGSPRQAAQAIGRHAFGAERLRKGAAGKEFAEAWDAAMELSQEREYARISANLEELAESREADLVRIGKRYHPDNAEFPLTEAHDEWDEEDYDTRQREVRERLLRARRLYLQSIVNDPEKRAAWEVLVGPVDWDRATRCEHQDNETPINSSTGEGRMPSMRKPDMLLTAQDGWLAEMTGGPCKKKALFLAAIKGGLDEARAHRDPAEEVSEEEAAEQERIRAELLADGWVEDDQGNLRHESQD